MFAIAGGYLWALSFMKVLLCVVGVGVIQIFPLSYVTHVTENLKISNICVGLSDCSLVARPLD